MRTLLIGIVAGTVMVGTAAAQSNSTPPKAPTATEVFHLRTECAELGEKMLVKLYDSPLADQESHYDPSPNRCYVAIRFWKGVLQDGVLVNPKLTQTLLYDGQTGGLLAYYKLEGTGCPNGTECQKVGKVFVDSARSNDADVAFDFITNAMADNRKH
jgi:hypothetical protein